MKTNYWTIDACPEAGNFDTLSEAKRHTENYTYREKREIIGTVIYHTVGEVVVSSCEITGMDAAGRLTFGRVKTDPVYAVRKAGSILG